MLVDEKQWTTGISGGWWKEVATQEEDGDGSDEVVDVVDVVDGWVVLWW